MSRYAERRADAVRGLADPARQLRVAISLGVPTGPDDEDSRLLYELDAMTGASKLFATLSAAFFDRQVMLYERVLERGVDRAPSSWGPIRSPSPAASSRWRMGSGSRSCSATRRSTRQPERRCFVAWASAATGADLRSVDRAPASARAHPRRVRRC